MNIIVNSDRTVEKEYTEKDGSQNENRVTELNFTLPEEYSGEGFVPKIAFITEDGNFSDYIEDGLYVLKNNITKYREVVCFVWLTNSVNNIDFRSQTFPLEFYYNEDPSDYIPSEQEKSQIELLMEELEQKIQEVTELEENVYTKDETYSKEEVDEIIPTDISDLNNDSGFIDKDVNNLTNYYKKSETYTKQEIDGKISSVYKYKGTVASYNNLPSTGLTIGDVYNVEDTGDNYAWTGTDWDKLGGDIDLSGYQTKIDSTHKLNADLVDDSNSTNKFTNTTEKNSWNAKYTKPNGGIPKADLAEEVKASLNKADTALQAHQDISGKEDKSNKTGILDENSTDTQYPSAKTVYDNFVTRDEEIEKLQTENAQLLADHPDILDENDEFPSGTDLTLNGTGDLKMKVDVGGNSTQFSTTGKNIIVSTGLTETTKYGVTITPVYENNMLKYINVNGTFDNEASADNYGYTVGNISVTNGESYTLSGVTGFTSSTLVLYIKDSNLFSGQLISYNGEQTKSAIGTGTTACKLFIYKGTTYNNVKVYPMLCKNNTDATYEPYTNGASPNPTYPQNINNVEGDVEVKGSSKNFWKFPKIFFTTNNTSWFDSSGVEVTSVNAFNNSSYKITLKEGTYYFKSHNPINNDFIQLITVINNTLSVVGTNNEGSFTLTEETTILPRIKANTANTLTTLGDLQIEKGTVATSYVPFAENSVTFPLSQGQKLMLGDTLEDDGIHHKRNQVVFDGSNDEDWRLDNTFTNTCKFSVRGLTNALAVNRNKAICSHFTMAYNDDNDYEHARNSSSGFPTDFLIYIDKNKASSVAELRAWLQENQITVEYELTEETIDLYTLEQQTAYNKLKEMQSYYDLTYVVGSSDNAQPIITAHAKKSIKEITGTDLSNYQTKITSTNKLNSDLVDDTNQTNKFVTTSEKNTWDAKQNTTDNNLTTTNKNITSAINEVNSIAKGANQALSYASYSAMITAFNSASSTDYNVGQNIYIETLEVPDLWVYKVESTSSSYTYTTDSAFTAALETNGYVQVGYYKLSALETQKVDLTNYVENTDYATSSTAGVGKVGAGTGINISAGGVFYIASATSSEINAKTNSFKPIVPTNLDYAVSNIVGHHVTLTQTQYEALVSGGTVDSNTFYYTTEDTQE